MIDAVKERLERGIANLNALLASGGKVYGVNTGFGDSCQTEIPVDSLLDLPHNLVRFHGCGTGQCFTREQTAAIMVARAASLVGMTQLFSGRNDEAEVAISAALQAFGPPCSIGYARC